eukprot:m.5001 g.5001  ORF g.5001 m.5001 type:complete len:100 (+) comp4094_c0_seq2:76-375(+)
MLQTHTSGMGFAFTLKSITFLLLNVFLPQLFRGGDCAVFKVFVHDTNNLTDLFCSSLDLLRLSFRLNQILCRRRETLDLRLVEFERLCTLNFSEEFLKG